MLFGINYALYFIFQLWAIKNGKISIISLILSYSLLIPTLFGIIFFGEYPDLYFFIALALLFISLFLINYKKNEEKSTRKKIYNKWIIFVIIAFICNGTCSVVQSYQQKNCNGLFKAEFMIIAMIFVFVLNIILLFLNKKNALNSIKKGWHLSIMCGLFNALVNLLIMKIVIILPVSLVFPLLSAGSILFTYILSKLFFKETLTKLQNIGFIIGLFSIILFNI